MGDIIQLLNEDSDGVIQSGMVNTIIVNENGHSYLKSTINWDHPELQSHLAICKMKREGFLQPEKQGDAIQTYDIPDPIHDMVIQQMVQMGVTHPTEQHKWMIKKLNNGDFDMFRCTSKKMKLKG